MNRNNWRLPLCIAISSVFITPAFAELTVLPGETYLNTVTLENIDLILNQGVFDNSALVGNLDFSTFNNQGSTLNNADMFFQNQSALLNYGSFENLGRMYFYETARFENYGSFLNAGAVETSSLTNQASAVFTNTATGVITMNGNSVINNVGVFNHNGDFITGLPTRPFVNTLNNSGTFNNNGRFMLPFNEFHLNNSGTFNNYTDIELRAPSSEIVNSGRFENNARITVLGSLINTATGVFNNLVGQWVEVQGVVNNQGVFNNDSELRINEGFVPYTSITTVAELNNSGVFNHTSGLSSTGQQGLNIINSGEFNNNNGISSEGRIAIDNSGVFNNNTILDLGGVNAFFEAPEGVLVNAGTFNNRGSIFGAGYLENNAAFENAEGRVEVVGRLLNNAAGTFNNGTFGFVRVAGVLENRGEFNNQFDLSLDEIPGAFDPFTGRPFAAELNNSGMFNNTDIIRVAASEGLNLINAGTFNNNGTLDSTRRTVITNSGVFNNNRVLDLTASDMRGSEVINAGTFNNNAELRGVTTLDNTGTFQNDGFVEDVSSLLNSGLFENNFIVRVMNNFVNRVTGVYNNGSEFYQGITEVSGVLQNQGEFNNIGYVELARGFDVNTGMFVNAELNNSGVFNNSGIISSSNELVINNSGEFNHIAQTSLPFNTVINNSGTFNNGGMFDFRLSPFLLSGNSQFNNTGRFNNNRVLDGGTSANLINRGIINNSSSIRSFNQITNEGTINNDGEFYLSEIVVNNTLDNRGTLNNSETSRIELSNSFGGGSAQIQNSGTIVNNGEITGFGDINNQGTITNNASIQGSINIVSNGLITNTGSINADNIEISGRLEGTGNINLTGLNGLVITEAGTLAPAYINNPDNPFAPSNLTINNMLALDGTLEVTFNEFGFNDAFTVTGPVLLGTNSVLDVSLQDYNWGLGNSYDLMFADSISGDFGDFFYSSALDPSLALEWSIFSDGFGDILRIDVVSAVPLPASVWLFISGIVGLISIRRRKH